MLVHYLKDLLSCIDFELVEQTASVGDRVQANIIGLRGPTTAGDGLILSSPLDTVPYLDRETWRTCAGEPLEPVLAGGAIFGLGARSGKVDFLCKLKAASQFQGRSFSRPLYLVGTFGHYQDFLGVRTLLETHLFRAKRVLVGWPTNLELVTMVKSHVVFRFVFSRSDGIPLEGHSVLTHLSTASCAPSEWPALGRDVLREALEAFARAQEIDPDLALVGISSLAPAGLSPGTCRIDAATASGKELGTEWTVTPESAPSFDLSAITPALRALLQVLDENVAELVPTADHSFRPPQATMSVRQVRTTDDGVSLTMLGRFLPEHDVSALIEHLQAGVEQLSTAFAGL
ncbi:MAG: hypothetical protein KC609_01695, partial [Myxococcales bacterium]|nr:hypothetical protein [Myxococcales bacterium]